MYRVVLSRLLSLVVLCVLGLFFAQPILAQEDIRFNKYNIHAQTRDSVNFKASYANFTDPGAGHVIIPAGTKITIIKSSKRGFVFTYDNGSKKVTFECHVQRMGMGTDEYIDLITASKPVSYKKLSKLDKEGIAAGKAYKGMTRKGVMVALGYPAAHKTPSLQSSTWTYWINRFKTVAVTFNDQGKVKNNPWTH